MLRILRRLETRALILLAAITGAVWAFLALGEEMAKGQTHAWDQAILLALRTPDDPNNPIGSRSFEEAMRDVTALGGFTVMTLVTVAGTLFFLLHRKPWQALVLLGAALVSEIGSDLLKEVYGRPRPSLVPHGAYVYSASFPSGHSLHAAAIYLTLAMLISSLEPRRATKVLVFVLAALFLTAIGASRVYLGVHWPTDVIGGWFAGAAIALAAWGALNVLTRRAPASQRPRSG